MEKPADKLTDRFVKAAEPPATGNRILYDGEVKGFGLRVTAKGAKAFILNYYANGRERRFTIGQYPDWAVSAAREEAKSLKREIDRGFDPLAKRIEDREAPTIDDLWTRYEKEHLSRKRDRSADDDRSMWENYILPRFRNSKVVDLTAADIDRMHREIGQTKPVRANRVVEVIRKALNLAIRWGWIDKNPAVGVERFHEEKRQRYLSDAELKRLSAALDAHPNTVACDSIRLLLLTGARKMEVLAAEWTMFDFETGIWTKPSSHTKQKRVHRIPLSQPALALLAALHDREDAHPVFVFRGSGASGHLVDNKRTWETVREAAGIGDVRMHDLRHTYAAVLASAGSSLPIIGALLGHTLRVQTNLLMSAFCAIAPKIPNRFPSLYGRAGSRRRPHHTDSCINGGFRGSVGGDRRASMLKQPLMGFRRFNGRSGSLEKQTRTPHLSSSLILPLFVVLLPKFGGAQFHPFRRSLVSMKVAGQFSPALPLAQYPGHQRQGAVFTPPIHEPAHRKDSCLLLTNPPSVVLRPPRTVGGDVDDFHFGDCSRQIAVAVRLQFDRYPQHAHLHEISDVLGVPVFHPPRNPHEHWLSNRLRKKAKLAAQPTVFCSQ